MDAPLRILIADDHPLFRDGVAQALGSDAAFALVGQAADARGAIRLSRELAPEVVLLDLGMPGGGQDAVREIRAASPATRVVVLTVSEDERDLREALRAGAIAYVLKGIPADELLDIVRGAWAGQGYVAPALAARLLIEVGPGT